MKLPKVSRDKYVVEAVDRALDVLECFADSEELGLSEISQKVKLNKSRTFRLLHTLHQRGYVARTPDGQHYKLGLRLFEYATRFRRDLKTVAQPYLRQLLSSFNETVNLGVIHNGEVLYIDLIESSRPFRMSAMVGSRMPVFSTSLGKAMAAHLPEQELKAFLAPVGLTNTRELSRELEIVRRRGYALDNEENEPGVACIGAPILDCAGIPIAAVSVSGSVGRVLAQQNEIGSMLAQICREISRQMGFAHQDSNATNGSNGLMKSSRSLWQTGRMLCDGQ